MKRLVHRAFEQAPPSPACTTAHSALERTLPWPERMHAARSSRRRLKPESMPTAHSNKALPLPAGRCVGRCFQGNARGGGKNRGGADRRVSDVEAQTTARDLA